MHNKVSWIFNEWAIDFEHAARLCVRKSALCKGKQKKYHQDVENFNKQQAAFWRGMSFSVNNIGTSAKMLIAERALEYVHLHASQLMVGTRATKDMKSEAAVVLAWCEYMMSSNSNAVVPEQQDKS